MQDQGFSGNIEEEMMGLKNLTNPQRQFVDATADSEDDQSWESLRTHPEFAEKTRDPTRDADDATDTESVALSAYAFLVHPHPVITVSAGSSLPPPMPVTPGCVSCAPHYGFSSHSSTTADCKPFSRLSGSPSHGSATAALNSGSPSHGSASSYRGSHHDSTTAECLPRDSASSSRGGPSHCLATTDCPSRDSASFNSRAAPAVSKYAGVVKFITLMAACYAVTSSGSSEVPQSLGTSPRRRK